MKLYREKINPLTKEKRMATIPPFELKIQGLPCEGKKIKLLAYDFDDTHYSMFRATRCAGSPIDYMTDFYGLYRVGKDNYFLYQYRKVDNDGYPLWDDITKVKKKKALKTYMNMDIKTLPFK